MKTNERVCINCQHSNGAEFIGDLRCHRIDNKTGCPVKKSCKVQRSSSRFFGLLTGQDFCGIKGKYFQEKEI